MIVRCVDASFGFEGVVVRRVPEGRAFSGSGMSVSAEGFEDIMVASSEVTVMRAGVMAGARDGDGEGEGLGLKERGIWEGGLAWGEEVELGLWGWKARSCLRLAKISRPA